TGLELPQVSNTRFAQSYQNEYVPPLVFQCFEEGPGHSRRYNSSGEFAPHHGASRGWRPGGSIAMTPYKRNLIFLTGSLFFTTAALVAQQKQRREAGPWRTVVMGVNGMVSAEHPLQARAGLRILESGGNAVDAAAAIFYMTAVTEQHQAGLGGDAYILAWPSRPRKIGVIKRPAAMPIVARAEC